MIKIEISGATPLEVLASTTAFGMRCQLNGDVYAAAQQILEAEKHKQAKTRANASDVSDLDIGKSDRGKPSGGAAVEEPYVGPTPFPETQTETTTKEHGSKPPTLEEVRAAGIEASHKYGTPAVKALLEQFGAANMTALAEKDRAAFMGALKGLGESNA